MRTYKLLLGFILAVFIAMPTAHAQSRCLPPGPCFGGDGIVETPIEDIANPNLDVTDVIITIIEFILDIILIIAVLMLIIAGVYLIVSLGEEGNKDKAKKIILYVIVGIIIILFARAIVIFVADTFANASST